MSGFVLTPSNIISVLAALYPLFIVSLLMLVSIFNGTILKGLIYFSGILILWCICRFIEPFWKKENVAAPVRASCAFIFSSFNKYLGPRFDVAITFFTFIYLIMPMFVTSNVNWSVFSLLLIFSFVHMIYDYKKQCTGPIGITFGLIFGLLFGLAWFSIFWYSDNKHLLFYNELLSNNVICNKPSDQKFKCRVYRNGQIISTSIMGNN